jgi:membrane protein
MGERLDRLRARVPAFDVFMLVQDRFGAVGGGPLSSSIALAAFFSLFPLLLVLIAVVGFMSSNDGTFAGDIIRTLGLTGDASDFVRTALDTAEESKRAATVIGLGGLLWSGLGVVASLETACNSVWQTTGRGLIGKLWSLLWLVGAAACFFATAALGVVIGFLPSFLAPFAVLVGVGANVALFLWTFDTLANNHAGWRSHLPGALLAGIGLEVLKVVGAVYVPRAVSSSSALYGGLGVVFAVLAWLAVYGRLIVYSAVLNVVLHERKAGTVTVELQVPRVNGEVPLVANRGGAVIEQADSPV